MQSQCRYGNKCFKHKNGDCPYLHPIPIYQDQEGLRQEQEQVQTQEKNYRRQSNNYNYEYQQQRENYNENPIFEENFTYNNNNNSQRVIQILNPDNENENKINEQPDQQNQCIYQFQQQQSNGITGSQKLLMFHQMLSFGFLKFLQQQNIHLGVRIKDHSYNFTHQYQNQDLLNSFFEQFKRQTDEKIFLFHQCQSKEEAYILFNCFLDDLFLSNFSAYINVQKKNIQFNISNHIIRQRFNFYNNNELIELAENFGNENIFFIILSSLSNHEDTDIKNYQNQLEEYLSNPDNLKKEQKIETFTLESKPNMETVLKESNELQKNYKYQQLILGQPKIDSVSLKFKLQLEIKHWLLNGKQMDLQLHNQIKIDLFSLFVGSEDLQLQKHQIQTWENILRLKYEKFGNNQDVQVKTIKENNEKLREDIIIIKLIGNRFYMKQIMDQLNQEINQYKCESFSFKILEQQIISNIKKIKESKAFSKKLKEIEQNNTNDEDISIQFDEIETQDQYLAYLVTYNKRNNLENLKDDLKKFSENLQLYSVYKLDTQELLDFLLITVDEFQEQYQLVVIPQQYNYLYIGEQSQIDQLIYLINQTRSSNGRQFKKIKIKSKIVFNKFKRRYFQEQEYIDNVIIETDDQLQIINLNGKQIRVQQLEKVIKIEEKIQEQRLITQKLELKPQEIKYLYKSKKEVLNSLEQKENCEFQITKKINENKIKYHIQIGDKNFYVIQGDIIKSEGDCIVNFYNDYLNFDNLNILADVTRSIVEKAGMHYVTECQNYILRNGNLPVGCLMITNTYNLSNFKYILTVNTPIYNQDQSNGQFLSIILNCIKSVFEEAINKGFQSIVFPVLAGGKEGYFDYLLARVMVNNLLQGLVQQEIQMDQQLKSNKIQDIYLVEKDGSKILILIEQLEQITNTKIKIKHGFNFINYGKKNNYKTIQESVLNHKPLQFQKYQKFNQFAQESQDSQNLAFSTYEMSITAENQQIIKNVERILKKMCDSSIKKEVIKLPINNNGLEFYEILKIIIDQAVSYQGNLQPNKIVTINAFQNTIDKIQKKLQTLTNYSLQTFQNYSPFFFQIQVRQTQNFIKIHLQQSDKEYITVQQSFLKTYQNGTIHAIYKIQNENLYQDYFEEKQLMLHKNQELQIELTPDEKERLVWHGTRNNHPRVLYEGMQNAFDNTFRNVGMWGQGICFSENALYSVAYSHQIQDDRQYMGKKVMLCCKVATGKVIDLQPNQQLRRPPLIDSNKPELGYYDCVSGFTNGSKVYILYSMDVRRAYPAYEVIYD